MTGAHPLNASDAEGHAEGFAAPAGSTAPAGSLSPYVSATDRPVFVGACPRSGTTLLRTMLNSHPELAIPHETRIISDVWPRRVRFGDLTDPRNRRRLAKWILRRKVVRAERLEIEPKKLVASLVAAPPTLGSVLGTCFLLYAEQHGKARWGDKRPRHVQHLDAIFAMFPDAQFIHVVRDPRGSVASMRKLGWYAGKVVPATELWARSVRAADAWRGRLAPDQFLEVRYEDLVSDPRTTLEQVSAFLGLDRAGIDTMLAFHENPDITRGGKFFGRVSQPVSTDAMRSWEEALSREEIALVEWAARRAMRRYGYEPAADGVRAPRELRRAFRQRRYQKARQRLRERATEAKLRFTYRHPVAARLTSAQLGAQNTNRSGRGH